MEGTLTTVERFCLIASEFGADDDCSYQYDFPPGSREVVETCRCQESFCNGGDISELGGKGDINSFPKEVIYYMSGSETMRLHYYQHLVYILVLKFMMQTF
ncbi:unnamed protein product [Orchesella dallaii]|uniref:Uncharacterized protein n=1 Tax=Orchesella dallaii TaxID=48710 RepID=A0ABP1S6D6_9HEXA